MEISLANSEIICSSTSNGFFFEIKCLFYDHINIKKIQLKKTNLNNLKLDHLTLVIIVFLLKMRTILYL